MRKYCSIFKTVSKVSQETANKLNTITCMFYQFISWSTCPSVYFSKIINTQEFFLYKIYERKTSMTLRMNTAVPGVFRDYKVNGTFRARDVSS